MPKTDTSETGLERLICTALTGAPCNPPKPLRPEVLARLSSDEKTAWEYIACMASVTTSALMQRMALDERKAQRILKTLREAGLLRRVGRGPATHYEVVRS